MLIVDPKDRFSAIEALQHPWFVSTTNSNVQIDPKVLTNLKNFRGVSKLKKAAMNMLVKMADQKVIDSLKEEFQKLDKDQTGLINVEELKQAMQ